MYKYKIKIILLVLISIGLNIVYWNENLTSKEILNPCWGYVDVDKIDFACEMLLILKSEWVIVPDDNFNPERFISRAELLSIILKSAKIPAIYYEQYKFDDINIKDWWTPAVSTAKKLWYITGENKYFNPNKPITRAEALQIIMKIKWIKLNYNENYLYNDIKSADWWTPAVSTAKKHWYISQNNKEFNPNLLISRHEAIIILYNVFYK